MTWYVHPLKNGQFEIIDGELPQLYPALFSLNDETETYQPNSKLIQLSDEDYSEYCLNNNQLTRFKNKKFIYTAVETDTEQLLNDAKEAKLLEINNQAQGFINKVVRLDEVPDFEVQTWQQQRDEALAWQADPEAETPMLATIAAARGIELSKLRQAALRKAIAFSQLTATIAGQRQAYVDMLNAATTLEAVEEIEVIYRGESKNEPI